MISLFDDIFVVVTTLRRSVLRAPRSALLTCCALAALVWLVQSPSSLDRPTSGISWDPDDDDGEVFPTEETLFAPWDGVEPNWASLMASSDPIDGRLPKWTRLASPLISSPPKEEPFPEAHRALLYPESGPLAYQMPKEAVDTTRRRSTFARDWLPLAEGMGTAWTEKRKHKVQHDFGRWQDSDRERQRREAVRNAFIWAWESYKRNAWGASLTLPRLQRFARSFRHLLTPPFALSHPSQVTTKSCLSLLSPRIPSMAGERPSSSACLLELLLRLTAPHSQTHHLATFCPSCSSLDTLLLLDLPQEFSLARDHVRELTFGIINGASWTDGQVLEEDASEKDVRHPQLPVFETTIRYLGGLLGAYELSGDRLMLERAEELAVILCVSSSASILRDVACKQTC